MKDFKCFNVSILIKQTVFSDIKVFHALVYIEQLFSYFTFKVYLTAFAEVTSSFRKLLFHIVF